MNKKVLLAIGAVVIIVLASLAGCSAGPKAAAADENPPISVNVGNQQTGIWVSGEGKVTVTPDIAMLTLGVSAKADKVADAQAQAAEAMDKVMKALTDAGIDSKDIQTQYYNISQITRWDDYTRENVVTGYQVDNTVQVKIRNVDKTGTIIDSVAAAGGDNTRINGISFSVDKPEQYYTQARELAMADAKDKAKKLADLAGVTLGRATYITESVNAQPYPIYYAKGYDMASGGAVPTTSISSGQSDIILNVQVNFAIE